MIFACIGVRFKDGIPGVNFNESPTYHEVDSQVIPPRRLPKAGDTVLIRTIGSPLVKMIVDRLGEIPNPDGRTTAIGGPICGKASFYPSVRMLEPFADNDTAQGGLKSAT